MKFLSNNGKHNRYLTKENIIKVVVGSIVAIIMSIGVSAFVKMSSECEAKNDVLIKDFNGIPQCVEKK